MVSSNRQSERRQNPTSDLCLYSPCTRTIVTFKLFSIHLLCICLCSVCMYVHGQHVYVEIRAHFLGISSSSTMGLLRINNVCSLPPFLFFFLFPPFFLPSLFSSVQTSSFLSFRVIRNTFRRKDSP